MGPQLPIQGSASHSIVVKFLSKNPLGETKLGNTRIHIEVVKIPICIAKTIHAVPIIAVWSLFDPTAHIFITLRTPLIGA